MPAQLIRTLVLIVGLALTLGACTRIDLAYRNLDRLVPWSLGDYLDMNRQQKALLDERLKDHLAWHCKTQLPGYLDWLDKVRQMVADQAVTDQALQQRTAEARLAIGRVAEAITPSAAELLRDMSDAQVTEMRKAFSDDIAERQKEYVDTPLPRQIEERRVGKECRSLPRQIEERATRMQKRLKPWLGELSAVQRQRVMIWSQALGDQNREWIANRQAWQQQLLLAMDQRQTPAFEPRLAQLLQDKQSLWSPAYRAAFDNTERQARSLLVDLLQQSSTAQRQLLIERLGNIIAPELGALPTAFFRVSIACLGLIAILAAGRVRWDFQGKLGACLVLGMINSGIPATFYSVAAQVLPAGYSAISSAVPARSRWTWRCCKAPWRAWRPPPAMASPVFSHGAGSAGWTVGCRPWAACSAPPCCWPRCSPGAP